MLQNTLQLYRNAYSGLSKEIWLLSLVSLINRAGAMVFPFLTIYLTQELGFSLKDTGLIMSCFGVGSIIGSYLGGWLTDQIGDFKVQFWSLISASLILLTLVQAQSFWAFAIIALTFSIFADAFRPANKVAVARYSKPENLTRSFALLRLAINVGFAIGPAMGGLLAAWKGYDWLFYADALTCFLAAILFKLSLSEDAATVTKDIQALKAQKKASMQSPYTDYFFLLYLMLIGLIAFAFMQLFFTMPVFLKQDFALPEEQIGLLMGLNGAIIVITEMPLVYMAEQKLTKFATMTMGVFLIGISFLGYLFPSNWIGIAIMCMVVVTLGEIFYMPFASAFVAERAEDSNRGQYMALYSMAWSAANIFAPTVGFFISEQFGFKTLWGILFVLGLICSLGFWMLGKEHGRQMKLA